MTNIETLFIKMLKTVESYQNMQACTDFLVPIETFWSGSWFLEDQQQISISVDISWLSRQVILKMLRMSWLLRLTLQPVKTNLDPLGLHFLHVWKERHTFEIVNSDKSATRWIQIWTQIIRKEFIKIQTDIAAHLK